MSQLSYAERGALSLNKRLSIMKEKKQQNIVAYNLSPKKCKYCGKAIPYSKRYSTYCNRSCAASETNKGKSTHNANGANGYGCDLDNRYKPTTCSYCGNRLVKEKWIKKDKPVFCCFSHKRLYFIEAQIKQQKPIHSEPLKYYLVHKRGYKCEECGITEWRSKPVPLESHHIDGDITNNKPNNLLLLCKNCHGLTDNYGIKNRGKSTRTKKIKHPLLQEEIIGSIPMGCISREVK